MKKLDARRARLDRTIALQKIFQSIILLNDSIDETKDSLEMNQGSNMIEGICSDHGFLDEAGCPSRNIDGGLFEVVLGTRYPRPALST